MAGLSGFLDKQGKGEELGSNPIHQPFFREVGSAESERLN
jgi:hypothetical protein